MLIIALQALHVKQMLVIVLLLFQYCTFDTNYCCYPDNKMLMGTTSCAWRPVSDCTSSSFAFDLVKVLNQLLQNGVFLLFVTEVYCTVQT